MVEGFYVWMQYFVLSFTRLLISVFELFGALAILFVAVIAIFKFFGLRFNQTSTDVRIRLSRGIAMGLQFYLAAEILRLITIREYKDLAIIGAIIFLHAVISALISWEVHHSIRMMKEELELDEKTDLICSNKKRKKKGKTKIFEEHHIPDLER